ncbi:hypothetical protein QJS10_CPB21g01039 [Acorus calamus]|uniref:Uncharacterized protein n=1 Tax=Acorus calamus TaxID=4465 RepID=A0AAV9C3W7_ACOCL|nr:hypothetical protein QJS10_CPB21g01039 [Acorus calamus]
MYIINIYNMKNGLKTKATKKHNILSGSQPPVMTRATVDTLAMTNATHRNPLKNRRPHGPAGDLAHKARPMFETNTFATAHASTGACFAGSSVSSSPTHPAAEGQRRPPVRLIWD